jgi:hypothetical protein
MKVKVYKDILGGLHFAEEDNCYKEKKYIGSVELDITPDKKMVTRETSDVASRSYNYGTKEVYSVLPEDARNIKVTYDIEE